MKLSRPLLAAVLAVLILPVALGAQQPWAVHAASELVESKAAGLEEVYVPASLSDVPEPQDDHVRWTWWSWSEETGSDWPDDDALYRASNRNLSLEANEGQITTEQHALPAVPMVTVTGEVRVVSAEDRARMVAFDLEVTPLQNLSNHTILYVVLTEDRAVDVHQRTVHHLVRELRPEVGFSVKANNSTAFVSMLPADHLQAAGVDLQGEPNGWSYTVVVFGGEAETDLESQLLWMAHGPLPSPQQTVSPSQAWTPLLLTAVAAVVAVSIIGALRQREGAIPQLQATWSPETERQVHVQLRAGSHPFNITGWTIGEPWQFKGRPPRLSLAAGEQAHAVVEVRELVPADLHLDVAIEIEDFGAWKQHLWLRPSQKPSATEANDAR